MRSSYLDHPRKNRGILPTYFPTKKEMESLLHPYTISLSGILNYQWLYTKLRAWHQWSALWSNSLWPQKDPLLRSNSDLIAFVWWWQGNSIGAQASKARDSNLPEAPWNLKSAQTKLLVTLTSQFHLHPIPRGGTGCLKTLISIARHKARAIHI